MMEAVEPLIFQIEIANSGEVILCESGQTVLNAMEQLGRKGIPVGCRGGGCGVCLVRVMNGHYRAKKMSREHVSELQEKSGYALACRLKPTSDLVISVEGKMDRAFAIDEEKIDMNDVQGYWRQLRHRKSVGLEK